MRLRPAFVPAVLAVVALSLTACGGEDSSEASESGATDSGSVNGAAETSCDYPGDAAGAAKPVDPPPAQPTATGEVPVTISTTVGDLNATLDADSAPCTVNSFLSLAEQGYFDDTPCHRMTTAGIYVLQCGDPSGTGTGGPGYSFADELTGAETYGPGTLAMANAGPNTNGSQFFIVYGDSPLDPNYTVFGHVDDDAVATVTDVADKGVDNANQPGDGHPKQAVTIQSVTAG
jgi:peptidyl-prolyl cis-trans isomerase B (cyclophilin B)